jgi:hypothetical protein
MEQGEDKHTKDNEGLHVVSYLKQSCWAKSIAMQIQS